MIKSIYLIYDNVSESFFDTVYIYSNDKELYRVMSSFLLQPKSADTFLYKNASDLTFCCLGTIDTSINPFLPDAKFFDYSFRSVFLVGTVLDSLKSSSSKVPSDLPLDSDPDFNDKSFSS